MGIKCPNCQFENPKDTQFCGKCGTRFASLDDISPSSLTDTLETPLTKLKIGSIFAKRYKILEELGRGGMGEVYRVLDEKIDEEIALKVLKPEIAAYKGTVARFKNELKYARKIAHRNVCKMYDLNEEEGLLYITMEYVKGEDLKSYINRKGHLTEKEAIRIVMQVSEGLSEAHEYGVIHRDLKPQNIMIDEKGLAKVMDFGIARSVEGAGITQTGIMIGTPDYISPEQVKGKKIDHRTDLYSLGVLFYEMLSGMVPFKGDTALSVAYQHVNEPIPSLKKTVPGVPDYIDGIVGKLLKKTPETRYQTAQELLKDVRNEKVEPTPKKRAEKPKKKEEMPVTVIEPTPVPVSRRGKSIYFVGAGLCLVALVVVFFVYKYLQKESGIESGEQVQNTAALSSTAQNIPEKPAEVPDSGTPGDKSVEKPLEGGQSQEETEEDPLIEVGVEEKPEQKPNIKTPPIEKPEEKITTKKKQIKPVIKPALSDQMGTLLVASNPSGADLYIEGVQLGKTPFSIELPQGEHNLRIVKSGYRDIEDKVDIETGRSLDKVYPLERLGSGWFELTAYPPAEVKIDGKFIGKPGEMVPPRKRIEVEAGTHKVSFIIKGDEGDEVIETIDLSVLAGESKRYHHMFKNLPKSLTEEKEIITQEEEKGTGKVRITATPYARVLIDGKDYGIVPPPVKDIELSSGEEHTITFIMDDLNKRHIMKITLKKGESRNIIHKFD